MGPDLDVSASASFDLRLGDDDASKIAEAAAGLVYPVEFFGDAKGSQTKRHDDAANVDYIRLHCHQRVPTSCWWEVRSWRMVKNGSPFGTSTSGELIYVFAGDSGDDFTIGSFVDNAIPNPPAVGFYSSGQVVGYPGASIYFAIASYDVTATYAVRGTALQRPYRAPVVVAAAV